MLNPSTQHHNAVNRALAYLYSMHFSAIQFSGVVGFQDVFVCFSDTVYGDDINTRHSTEAYLFKLFGGPIDRRSTQQKTVTTLSTEAEFLSLSHAAKELCGWQRFFQYLKFSTGHCLSIYCDKQQTIQLFSNEPPRLETRLCHNDFQQHWLQQKVQAKHLQVDQLPTAQMPADGLTRSISHQKYKIFVKLFGLVDIKDIVT